VACVSEPLARLYDLALRTLDDQDRRADALRGRLGPTLAAAALGVTLLSGPLVGNARPATLLGKLALVIAVGGLALTVGAAFRLLLTGRAPDADLDARRLLDEFTHDGALDDEIRFHTAMIRRFAEAQVRDVKTIERLAARFTAMLCGILVMLCGLALAALVG
jgi:hypothetical protein